MKSKQITMNLEQAIKTFPDKSWNWGYLSMNPNAIHILEKNLDKVDWSYLSKNPNAIHILEKNLEKVNWRELSSNPNAIHILEKNMEKVDWYYLYTNNNIFKDNRDINHIISKTFL